MMIVGFSATMRTESLAEFVRRVRIDKNLSTGDVSRRSLGSITDAYVSRIENGLVKNVSPEKLQALAKGLGVVESEIFRVARGLKADAPTEVSDILAETFGGEELTADDWREIEAVVKVMIQQKRRRRVDDDIPITATTIFGKD